MPGKLYGVGVGPGDPELLTLKALRLIKECDVIAVPGEKPSESIAYRIAKEACPEIADKEQLMISTPMTKDKELLENEYKRNARKIELLLNKGKTVVFVTLGDPTIYSTYIYFHRIVTADGYPAEIINGVPSFCAAASTIGDSLVDREMQLHIIPASYQYDDALDMSGARIFMKAGSSLCNLKKKLESRDCKAVMVENCGLPEERIYMNKNEFPENGSYFSVVVVKE